MLAFKLFTSVNPDLQALRKNSICLHILSALEFNSGNNEKGLALICKAGKLLVENTSKEGGDLVSEEGRKLMIMETLARMLLDFDSNEDARIFGQYDKPTGDVDVDIKLAGFYANAADLQRQQPQTNQMPEQELAVFFEKNAIEFLRSACKSGFTDVNNLKANTAFGNLQKRKDFVELVDEMTRRENQ